MKEKIISVYVKGSRNSTAYYRIYQYLDRMPNVHVKYHIMYPKLIEHYFMPVSERNFIVKMIIWITALFRMTLALLNDCLSKPKSIIIHKRVISRYTPVIIKFLLLLCKHYNIKIIWDFDDHLVEGRELTKRAFDFYSKISDDIIVTHLFLKSLVNKAWQNKIIMMPTTDGDMYNEALKKDLLEERLRNLKNEVRLVWVATSGNMVNLEYYIKYIEEAAKDIFLESKRKVLLYIVCDKPLKYPNNYLEINNIKWSRASAIRTMGLSHIGIMPLLDTEYNKGKGGFKLVQYMSYALPCIGSKVGFNNNVIDSSCGFLVSNGNDWIEAIKKLSIPSNWRNYSIGAFSKWNSDFSYEENLKKWNDLLN